MSVLCWKISPAPKHTHLDTNDNLARLTCIKLLFFTHEPPSLQQVSEITWAWGLSTQTRMLGHDTHTHTHGLHLNQERRDRLFDLEAQTKVLTCTSSNRGDMYKCVQTWTHTHIIFMWVLTFFLGHTQTVRHISELCVNNKQQVNIRAAADSADHRLLISAASHSH